MKQYNSLLRKLRFLGIYHDEHMVSQKAFLYIKISRCIHFCGAMEATRNGEQFLLVNLKQFHEEVVNWPKENAKDEILWQFVLSWKKLWISKMLLMFFQLDVTPSKAEQSLWCKKKKYKKIKACRKSVLKESTGKRYLLILDLKPVRS